MEIHISGQSYNVEHSDLQQDYIKAQILAICQIIMSKDQFEKFNLKDIEGFSKNQLELLLKQLDFFRDNRSKGVFKRVNALKLYRKLVIRTRQILFYNTKPGLPLDESFYTELVEDVKADVKPSFEVSFKLKNGAVLKFNELKDYDPSVTPGRKIPLEGAGLCRALDSRNFSNYYRTLEKDNPNTPQNEGIIQIVDYLLKDYFPENSQKLIEMGIHDVKKLTPRQAIELACIITMDRMTYSRLQAIIPSFFTYSVNDEKAIDDILIKGPKVIENGVCRNYAAVVYGVFEALKLIQDPVTTLLDNTYCLVNAFEEGVVEGGHVQRHAWNSFVTLTSNNEYHTVIVDSTWADDKMGLDPSRTSAGTEIDYTSDRLLTTLHRFAQAGLIDPKEEVKGLHSYHFQNKEMYYIAARRILILFADKKIFTQDEIEILEDVIKAFEKALKETGPYGISSDICNLIKLLPYLPKDIAQNVNNLANLYEQELKYFNGTSSSYYAEIFVLYHLQGKMREASDIIAQLNTQKKSEMINKCYELLIERMFGFIDVEIDIDLTLEDLKGFLARLFRIFKKFKPNDLNMFKLNINPSNESYISDIGYLYLGDKDSDQHIEELIRSSIAKKRTERHAIESFIDQVKPFHPFLHVQVGDSVFGADRKAAVVKNLPQFLAVLERIPEYDLRGRTILIGSGQSISGEIYLDPDDINAIKTSLSTDKRQESEVRQKINAVISRLQGELGFLMVKISGGLLEKQDTLVKIMELERILKKIGGKKQYEILIIRILEPGRTSGIGRWGELEISLGDTEQNITETVRKLLDMKQKIKDFKEKVDDLAYYVEINVPYDEAIIEKLPQYLKELERIPLYRLRGKTIQLQDRATYVSGSDIYWGLDQIEGLFKIYDPNGLSAYKRDIRQRLESIEKKYNVRFCDIDDKMLLDDEERQKLIKYIQGLEKVLAKFRKSDLDGMIFDIYQISERGNVWINFRRIGYNFDEYKDSEECFNVIQINGIELSELKAAVERYILAKKKLPRYLDQIAVYHPSLKVKVAYDGKVMAVLPKLVEILKRCPQAVFEGKTLNVLYGYYGASREKDCITVGSLSLESLLELR